MKRLGLAVGTYHHVILRGARGMDFMHDDGDRWMNLKLLYYQNDHLKKRQWERDIENAGCKLFERPEWWPERQELTNILAFCFHDNHIHLILKEIIEGGISEFMHRFPNSISIRYNKKYGGSGTVFQGGYQNRRVENDGDMLNLALYVMAKNVFERYEGGIIGALQNLEAVYKWALQDPFSSFAEYGGDRKSPIIQKDILAHLFSTPKKFQTEVIKYLKNRQEREECIEYLLFGK